MLPQPGEVNREDVDRGLIQVLAESGGELICFLLSNCAYSLKVLFVNVKRTVSPLAFLVGLENIRCFLHVVTPVAAGILAGDKELAE